MVLNYKAHDQETRKDDVHPIDHHYASMRCGLQAMEKDEKEYEVEREKRERETGIWAELFSLQIIADYLARTHGDTFLKMAPINAFRVS